jgi:hypothetical protein
MDLDVIVEKSRVLEWEERNGRIWYYYFFLLFSN